MSTTARPTSELASHWYDVLGNPVHEVPRADGSGMRATTLADARKLNLVPSVTNILRVLDKPALTTWKIEQAVLACLTTPKFPNEGVDAYVYRVLHTEKVQEQESKTAMDLGTRLHDAMECLFTGKVEGLDPELIGWVAPAYKAIYSKDCLFETEFVVVGDGYAGRCDLAQKFPDRVELWDWKTTKKLPKSAYPEHRMQLAAYAKALNDPAERPILTGNVYISTVNKGEFAVCRHDEYGQTYWAGFKPAKLLWQWMNNYSPNQPEHNEPL